MYATSPSSMTHPIDIEFQFYEKFFFSKDLTPYPVQEEAFRRIFAGENILVTVPTGTGKTLIAKAGIYRALAHKKTVVYTTPLRALTEEKYRELSQDFGNENVGFATGDYSINPQAPVQVFVAEILWNQIFDSHIQRPADLVIMDEGHYFNSPDRGYVWEESIIGLDPRTQLIILSATIGNPIQFCNWVSAIRQVPLWGVEGKERKVPLYHQYRENYLVEVVKDLAYNKEVPAIVFVFGRDMCFETARLLKTCRRFTTDKEQQEILSRASLVLLNRGISKTLLSLLSHGIGIHHAGILPRYKQLVEELTLDKLLKFVICTETISAGINLPAKRVIFPSLSKVIQGQARLLTPEEYQQMAGRAGRPQFDTEGVAITLAPEQVTSDIRKEITLAKQKRYSIDEQKIRNTVYARAKSEASRNKNLTWGPDVHEKLSQGKPAPLKSHTQVTADQILTIGLPSSGTHKETSTPAFMSLNMQTIVDNLFIDEKHKHLAKKQLNHLSENLRSLGIIDSQGHQTKGTMIRNLRGIDGVFVYFALMQRDFSYQQLRELLEYVVDHGVIHNKIQRKEDDKKREWIKARLKELRAEGIIATIDGITDEYERRYPKERSLPELIHSDFLKIVPHQELHGGKIQKYIWSHIEDNQLSFFDFVEKFSLENEEGNLFNYIARLMKTAKMLFEQTSLTEFYTLEKALRSYIGAIDQRILESVTDEI